MLDIAVIGGGPAGLTAGMYGARGGANVAVFEGIFWGGQTALTHWIENFPGFPEGVAGADLSEKMAEQTRKFGAHVHLEQVEALKLQPGSLSVTTNAGTYATQSIILCMGAAPRVLGLAQESRLKGMGVSYCATCDGAFFRSRPVAVVGGGDTAAADAIYLARMASEVHLIHRRDALRAAKHNADAVKAERKITVHWDTVVEDILGLDAVEGVLLKNVRSGETDKLDVNAVFVAVGIEPRTALVQDLLAIGNDGGIITDEKMRTNIAGVYAAGDVRSGALRQNVAAASDGATAAMDALLTLRTKK